MNYAKIEKRDKAKRRRIFFLSCIIHLGLLGGIYYLNAEDPTSIFPDFVAEWLSEESEDKVASTQNDRP